MKVNPPEDIQELKHRCKKIIGMPISSLANELSLEVPVNLQRAKGWIGQLLETYLGATASSKAAPDFESLGIELKTIPIDKNKKPLESTYVCTVQTNNLITEWEKSWVCNKLKHVLWIPILSSKEIPIADRIIENAILWQPSFEVEQVLKEDWEELMEMLELGYGKDLSAQMGEYLHIRPKAANSKILVDYVDSNSKTTKIVPKGFYLRSSFTYDILKGNL